MPSWTRLLLMALFAGILGLGCISFDFDMISDYQPPAMDNDPSETLVDDALDDKPAPSFDPKLVDRRPAGDWLLNASAAVIKLDVPPVKPDVEADLLTLHPSYAAAIAAAKTKHPQDVILPSVNLIDGKAKQFDDGLFAALDQAYCKGLYNQLRSHVKLVQEIHDKLDRASPAVAFLAAALELAGTHVEGADQAQQNLWLKRFNDDAVHSQPIGFYTWSQDLKTCFRFLRFLQHEFSFNELAVPAAIRDVLAQDPTLLSDYHHALSFYAHLTNPAINLAISDLPAREEVGVSFDEICKHKKATRPTVSFLPSSTSRETVLFDKLFKNGLPPDVNLMQELLRKIRFGEGEMDLKPGPDSGWYEYQAYALETMLLPEKGEEAGKLLLTKAYKKRMIEAFKAIVTKTRATHVRQLASSETTIGMATGPNSQPALRFSPRLRVEPNPSFYLRTARAYSFLNSYLLVTVGKEGLQTLHGLVQDGQRVPDLYSELHFQRDLFYGLYLISAEDLGLKPTLAKEEVMDPDKCYKLASDWLAKAFDDPDLERDPRVSAPIFTDRNRKVTRLWATLGVRLARLDADYARPPSIKAKTGGDWRPLSAAELDTSHYLIPVDEFAEVELKGTRVLTREELRAACNQFKTKEAIVRALK